MKDGFALTYKEYNLGTDAIPLNIAYTQWANSTITKQSWNN